MRLAVVAAAAFFALPASAGGMWRSDVRPGQMLCSSLPDPAATPVSVSNADDLQAEIASACGAGPCILELDAGTYTGINLQLGTGGASIGGEVVIRAANPASKPLLRATVDVARAVIQVRNVTYRVRVEDVVLDGRRSSQTATSMADVCDDLDDDLGGAPDGICDDGDPQNTAAVMGIDSRNTAAGTNSTCALRVDVIETVGDAFFLRDQVDSAVEASTVLGAGCDDTTCPSLSVPADWAVNSRNVVARGVNWVDSARVMAVGNTVAEATKQGLQCFASSECYQIGNQVDDVGSSGITMLGSSGVVLENAIDGVGVLWAPNTTTDSTGYGIDVTDGGEGLDYRAALRDNTIANTWGSGIVAGLQAGTPPAPEIVAERNSVSTTCTGSTSTTNGGIVLGDNVDPHESVVSTGNTVSGSACSTGFRIRELPVYTGSGNTVGTTGSGLGVVYADVDMAESSLTVDANITIDAASTGTLSGCTLNGGAIVSDSSGGAVTRSGGC